GPRGVSLAGPARSARGLAPRLGARRPPPHGGRGRELESPGRARAGMDALVGPARARDGTPGGQPSLSGFLEIQAIEKRWGHGVTVGPITLDIARGDGAQLREVSLPNLPLSVPTYYVVAPAEASSNLARFDGVRYGYRCKEPRDLLDLYQRSRGEGFGAEVKRRIMTGTYVLSAGYYDAYD